MMPSLPHESTQKLFHDDCHIIFSQKRKCTDMYKTPSPPSINGRVGMWEKLAFWWYPYHILPKKAMYNKNKQTQIFSTT